MRLVSSYPWRTWTSVVIAASVTTAVVFVLARDNHVDAIPFLSTFWKRIRERRGQRQLPSTNESGDERHDGPNTQSTPSDKVLPSSTSTSTFRVAFLGNSILYFNDCPRLLQQMLGTRLATVEQDSCLRPSANLVSLWRKGNGMSVKFRTPAALQDDGVSYDVGAATVKELLQQRTIAVDDGSSTSSSFWNFIVLNDHTRAPVRSETKNATKQAFTDHYAELFGTSEVVLLQTAAYREPNIHDTEDLGDFEEFASRVEIGYLEYAQYLKTLGVSCRIAPFGRAVRYLHQHNQPLWHQTYSWDSFHPSPHGTWLMACVLFCTLLHQTPPTYNPEWWKVCRYFATPASPLPTAEEANELSRVATIVCKVQD